MARFDARLPQPRRDKLVQMADGEKPFRDTMEWTSRRFEPPDQDRIQSRLEDDDDASAFETFGTLCRRRETELGPKKAAEGADQRPAWETPEAPFATREKMASGLAKARATGDEAKRKSAWRKLETFGLPPLDLDDSIETMLKAAKNALRRMQPRDHHPNAEPPKPFDPPEKPSADASAPAIDAEPKPAPAADRPRDRRPAGRADDDAKAPDAAPRRAEAPAPARRDALLRDVIPPAVADLAPGKS